MERVSLISPDVLARYAADAAREVGGVSGLADGALQRGRGVEVSGAEGSLAVRVHVVLAWGQSASEVARAVQHRVAEYLERMADVTVAAVDVVVDGVGAPPAKQ